MVSQREAEHAGKLDCAVKGSSALREAALRELGHETARTLGHSGASVLRDMQKFYDSIDPIALIDRALMLVFRLPCYTSH